MDRLDKIRENLAECQKYGGFVEGYISADNVSYLLERIDELETQNRALLADHQCESYYVEGFDLRCKVCGRLDSDVVRLAKEERKG